jgi:hypothetical protein
MTGMMRPPRAAAAIATALLAAINATAAPSSGACAVAGGAPCVIDLHGPHAPKLSANCTTEPWSRYLRFTLPDRIADSNKDGWWETVVEIALDPAVECGGANFRIHFEDPIDEWSVNIGDSPTNNGLGGDAGTTNDSAELQVCEGLLSVFTAATPNMGTLRFDRILDLNLPPLGGKYADVKISDQSLSFDMPGVLAGHRPLHWKLQTPIFGLLYALVPRAASSGPEGARKKDKGIYAAFNRVVFEADKTTETRATRVGTGVRRVEITLTP